MVLEGYDDICGYVRDTAVITLNKAPLSGGTLTDYGACKGDTISLPYINYTQSFNYTATGGTGTFYTNGGDPRYFPGVNDQLITFSVNGVAMPGCSDASFTFNVTIHKLPTANAGSDATVCTPTDTLRMHGNVYVQDPAADFSNGFWYQSGFDGGIITERHSASKTSKQFVNSYPVVYFDGEGWPTTAYQSDALAGFDEAPYGKYDLVWKVREFWTDIPASFNNNFCVARDTMKLTFIRGGGAMSDTLTAMAGLTRTKSLVANDSLYGQSYTVSIVDNGNFPQNFKSFDAKGILTYINKSTLLNGRDTLRYSLRTPGCPLANDTFVVVKLVNGAPFIPDTAKASTSVQKKNNVVTTLPLNLSLVFADYNENINWNTLTSPAHGSLSEVTISHNLSDPPYILKLTYSSERAALFTGEDVITFNVCDKLNACYTGKYIVNVIPDYEHPAVPPEKFQVINAISPNGDDVNDYMLVGGLGDYHNTVVIYNRWSQEVWRGVNYNNTTVKFEGISNVKGLEGPLPEGTYFYVIKNEGMDENDERRGLHSGYIELRR